MKRAAWFFALMIAASSCVAQTIACDDPTPRDNTTCTISKRVTDPAPPLMPTGIVKAIGNAIAGTRAYVWSLWGIVENHADQGEHVGVTGQCFGYAESTCWGGVHEAHGLTPNSNVIGSEVDVMANGPMQPGNLRDGILLVVGKSNRLGRPGYPAAVPGPAHIGNAIDVVAMDGRTDLVSLDAVLNINLPCAVTCIRMPSGGSISWDAFGGDVLERFDWLTGYHGWENHGRRMFGVNMTHGGLYALTVRCPASVPASVHECVRVNETGFIPIYR